jgi:hypothetical protein
MHVSGQPDDPAALLLRKEQPVRYCTGPWIGFKAGLDVVKQTVCYKKHEKF